MILYNASSSYYSMIARYALLAAGVPFESKRMDIHLAKEQLSSWYMAINPKMTVPSLVDDKQVWIDSQDILKQAAGLAGSRWLDADVDLGPYSAQIVYAHYSIAIERLTFGKALTSFLPLRFIVPHMLRRIIKKLEKERARVINKAAVDAKIALNTERLDYFTKGDLDEKLEFERKSVLSFLEKLPIPKQFLFGDKPSSADIVTAVLFARLKMIGEYQLVKSPELIAWFGRIQQGTAYKEADIWIYFQPLRILFRR
jgi:glutathione S-transferase